jgi:hypothetical protein
MALVLTDFTSAAELRAVLGANTAEVTDAMFALPFVWIDVQTVCNEVDQGAGNVLDQFETIKALTPDVRTSAQQQFYDICKVFVLYTAAKIFAGASSTLIAEGLGDGKADFKRRPDFGRLEAAISAGQNRWLARLKDLLLELVPTAPIPAAVTRTGIVGAVLGVDPVTGA